MRPADADGGTARALGIAPGDPALNIERVRFPCLGSESQPDNLHALYGGRPASSSRAAGRLKAVAARPREAAFVSIAPGSPLLRVDRTADALDGRPAEWRVSPYATADMHDRSDLG